MSAFLKTGDTVKVLSGKDRGKRAKVLRVLPQEGRALIEGVNLKKRHRRARRADRKGEIVLLPSPVASSSVQVVCQECGKPARMRRVVSGGVKRRVCARCGKAV